MPTAPLYVPETVTTTRLLELFRKSCVKFALVIDKPATCRVW